METKRHIRKKVLQLRDELTAEERQKKSWSIIKKVVQTETYKNAEFIMVYMTYKSEVQTEKLVLQALSEGKQVFCPKVSGEDMDFYRIDSPGELMTGYKGIPEPVGYGDRLLSGRDISMHRCLMLMPGSAFDRERNRIGYGKGYYDRYLERYPQLTTMALCFQCQIVEKAPSEAFDRKPDMILTEDIVILPDRLIR